MCLILRVPGIPRTTLLQTYGGIRQVLLRTILVLNVFIQVHNSLLRYYNSEAFDFFHSAFPTIFLVVTSKHLIFNPRFSPLPHSAPRQLLELPSPPRREHVELCSTRLPVRGRGAVVLPGAGICHRSFLQRSGCMRQQQYGGGNRNEYLQPESERYLSDMFCAPATIPTRIFLAAEIILGAEPDGATGTVA